MTYKELVDAAMSGKKAERVPFLILDGGTWVVSQVKKSFADFIAQEDAGAADTCRLFSEAGADWHNALAGFGLAWLTALGCKADLGKVGASIDVHPALDDPEEQIPLLDKSKIREALEGSELISRLLLQARGISEIARAEGKYVDYSILGAFSAAGVLVGTENLMGLIYDEPELVEQLLDYTNEACYQMIDLMHGAGCDIPVVCEPTGGGEMLSAAMYAEYVEPWLKSLMERTRDKCRYFTVHMCGNSSARVIPVAEAGFHGFSVDFKVDMAKAVREAGGRTCMFGNINPAGTVYGGTPEQVYDESRAAIAAAEGFPFALMPGCDLPYGVPMENLKAMRRAVDDSAK